MYWLTGYDTFGYVFFQTLILDNKGNIILLTRAPDLRQAQNTSNIEEIRIWIDKDKSKPADDLKNILDELSLKGKKVGVEYEAYGLTGRNALRLNKSLENYCNIEDQSELITKIRVIKSSEEIVYVKKAAELADLALDQAWKYTKHGASESKILAEMQKIVLEGGGDYPANEYIIGSGHNALLCRYQSEKRILSNRDQLSIEWANPSNLEKKLIQVSIHTHSFLIYDIHDYQIFLHEYQILHQLYFQELIFFHNFLKLQDKLHTF